MKKDFQPRSGMVFKTEDGTLGFYIGTPTGLVAYFIRNGNIDTYSDSSNYGFRETDITKIVEVYDGVRFGNYGNALIDLQQRGFLKGKLVWKRDDKVELTLQEIADKFNIPVDKLRIKE